ncbi:MAG: serine/threonine protein kinase [Candidatus Wallbacteria bacterium]|nr:serine/threonine protein kinase [Candidatus Wallbacteria bacterium]
MTDGTGDRPPRGRTVVHTEEPQASAASGAPVPREGLPTLPGYEPIALLGAGGQGMVVKALQVGLEREVVLKFLLPEYVGQGPMRERFFREARLTSKLTHPNVVKVLSVDEPRGAIVYEFVPGETLGAILAREGPLEPMDAVRLCKQAASALVEAHAAGILHRDIKPDNLLVAADGTLKVLDFGLARSAEGGGARTQTGAILGTPGYMPPEQVLGEEVGPAADIHALGATLFHLLTGRLPYEGGDAVELLRAALKGPPPMVRIVRPEVPAAVAAVVDKSLATRPQDRQADMAEMEKALGRCLRSSAAMQSTPPDAPRPASSGRVPAANRTMVSGRHVAARSLQPKSLAPGVKPTSAPAPAAPSRAKWVGAAVAGLVAVALATLAFRRGAVPAAMPPPPPAPPAAERPAPPPPPPPVVPLAPLSAVTVAEAREGAFRVALAPAGDMLVACWGASSGRLGIASSLDGARTWKRWAADERLRVAPRGEVQLAYGAGGLFAAWIDPSPPRAMLARLDATASKAGPPAPLGEALSADSTLAVAAGTTRDGARRVLVAWRRAKPVGGGSLHDLVAAWVSSEPKALSSPTRIGDQRSRPNRDAQGRFRVLFLQGQGVVLLEDAEKGDAPFKGLFRSTSPGPETAWTVPERLRLAPEAENPEFPGIATTAERTFLQWSVMEEGLVPGRLILAGRCSGPDLAVPEGRRLTRVPGRHVGANELAAHGNRLWSTWHEWAEGSNVWTSSPDGGVTWRPVERLVSYRQDWRPAALAVDSAGRCFTLWCDPAGVVKAMRLP